MGRKVAKRDGIPEISISLGNSKMGIIPSVSLRPVVDCPVGVPCAQQCYARRICAYRASLRAAYQQNSDLARNHRAHYFAEIDRWLSFLRPRFFRFHVSGDILDQAYLNSMATVARRHPDTRFLAFTKRADLDYRRIPVNLAIRLSQWPGMPVSRKHLPRAWVSIDDRAPADAIPCAGNCESCAACWDSQKKDVVIRKH